MTSDGISTKDWEVVQEYAVQLANILEDQDTDRKIITEKLLSYLECLEAKYGKLSSILATRADYIVDLKQRVKLLEVAHDIARQSNDRQNLTLTASSLAQIFVEELSDISSGAKWLASLADALGDRWDDEQHEEFEKLSAQLAAKKRRIRPDSLI